MFVDDAEIMPALPDPPPTGLDEALAPQALPETLVRRIRADWDRRERPARHVWRLGWTVPLAAAAVVAIVVVLPGPMFERAAPRSEHAITLSPEEAAEIVAAFDTLRWDSTFDETLESVSAAVASIDRDLRRQHPGAGASRGDDDWDVPPPESKPRSRLDRDVICTVFDVPTAGTRPRPTGDQRLACASPARTHAARQGKQGLTANSEVSS